MLNWEPSGAAEARQVADNPFEDLSDKLDDGYLIVDFCGELSTLAPNETLTFGREADIEIDENPFLHRRLGRFEQFGGHWWVANIGNQIELTLFDRTTRASAVVTPGSSQALAGADLVLRFVAGQHTYELLLQCPTAPAVQTEPQSDTVDVASVAWTDEQRLLLTILSEELLRDPTSTETFRLPTNQDARTRLGWGEAKFNRKLDDICDRLTASGVRGLEKGVGKRNNMRRRVLATFVVNREIVSEVDLEVLRNHEEVFRA